MNTQMLCTKKKWRTLTWMSALFLLALGAPDATFAQTRAELVRVRARLEREPPARDTVRASLEYFRVHPEAVDGLRSAARGRAAVPLLAGGYRYDDTNVSQNSQQTMFQPNTQELQSGTRLHSFTVGAVWDLREFVFNPAEIQAYGLVGIQRDVMLEVTRTYYMRRQLMLRLALRPPEDELARATLDLRVEEFTAILDTLTGGWFSGHIQPDQQAELHELNEAIDALAAQEEARTQEAVVVAQAAAEAPAAPSPAASDSMRETLTETSRAARQSRRPRGSRASRVSAP